MSVVGSVGVHSSQVINGLRGKGSHAATTASIIGSNVISARMFFRTITNYDNTHLKIIHCVKNAIVALLTTTLSGST